MFLNILNAHIKGKEGFSTEDEALTTEQRVQAAAEILKRYPWHEEGEEFLMAVDAINIWRPTHSETMQVNTGNKVNNLK